MKTMRYLPALTSLRFVAASMIVVHHVAGYFGNVAGGLNHLALDQGVSFFFVLSGFILFYRHEELHSKGEIWRFMAGRIARIWPLHAAVFALTLLFVPAPFGPGGPSWGTAAANLLLLQSWFPRPGYFFSWNAVSWSISTEMFFYVCYPLLSIDWRHTWHWKVSICLLAAVSTIYASWRLGLGFYDGTEHASIDWAVYIFPLARIFEFTLGMAAALFWRRWATIFSRNSVAGATMLEIVALLATYASMTFAVAGWGMMYAQGALPAAALKWLVESGSAPAFVLLTVAFASGQGVISRLLSWRPFIVLGEISFALYLCHQILFRALTASGSLAVFGNLGAQFAIYCAMALFLSYGLHMLIERPCQRKMMDLLVFGDSARGWGRWIRDLRPMH